MTFDINHFWGDDDNDNPILTNEMVAFAENALNVKLPPLFIQLLKKQNGGYNNGFAFPMPQKTSWAKDHIPFYELFGIVTDPTIESVHNILETDYMIKEWGLPKRQVLLTGEGHWWITLDYRNGENPTVRWIDVECGEDIHVADSFDSFIHGLVPQDSYADEE